MSNLDRARAINALIAEHVFRMWLSADRLYANHAPLRAYSEDIGAAWTVCEFLNRADQSQAVWGRFHEALDGNGPVLWGQSAADAARLICERALEALGVPLPDED